MCTLEEHLSSIKINIKDFYEENKLLLLMQKNINTLSAFRTLARRLKRAYELTPNGYVDVDYDVYVSSEVNSALLEGAYTILKNYNGNTVLQINEDQFYEFKGDTVINCFSIDEDTGENYINRKEVCTFACKNLKEFIKVAKVFTFGYISDGLDEGEYDKDNDMHILQARSNLNSYIKHGHLFDVMSYYYFEDTQDGYVVINR